MREIIVLGKEGCNPCDRVKRILHEMQADGVAMTIREVDMTSDEGTQLALQHNVLYPPAVFIDGRFLAYGKIHEADLQRALRSKGA